MRTGIGYPALFNDKSLIPRIESRGFSREQARDYVIFGCVYLHLPGLNAMHQGGGYTVLPKCLWWALHQGVDPDTGEQHGAPTKDPRTFRSVDDVMDAYLEQVRFFAGKRAQLDNLGKAIYKEYLPRPFSSVLLDGCIERGRDGRDWSPPEVFDHTVLVGPTNVVDRETLLDAQAHPEKHHDLIVRVAGYSAYFVDLSKGLQDSIIERTEHVL